MNYFKFVIATLIVNLSIYSQVLNADPLTKIVYVKKKPVEYRTDFTIYSKKSSDLLKSICDSRKVKIANGYCETKAEDFFNYVLVKDKSKNLKQIFILSSREKLSKDEITSVLGGVK